MGRDDRGGRQNSEEALHDDDLQVQGLKVSTRMVKRTKVISTSEGLALKKVKGTATDEAVKSKNILERWL